MEVRFLCKLWGFSCDLCGQKLFGSHYDCSLRSNSAFTGAHSVSRMLKYTESRWRPFQVSICLRSVPSSLAPRRRMACRDRWFIESVLSSTRRHFQVSNAWRSIKYLASVLMTVLCHGGAIQVDPISSLRFCKSMFM